MFESRWPIYWLINLNPNFNLLAMLHLTVFCFLKWSQSYFKQFKNIMANSAHVKCHIWMKYNPLSALIHQPNFPIYQAHKNNIKNEHQSIPMVADMCFIKVWMYWVRDVKTSVTHRSRTSGFFTGAESYFKVSPNELLFLVRFY